MKKNYIKNLLIILILFLSVSAVIIPRELNNLDEIWNYNFARNIAEGLLPYKDFNMVITPLLSMMCGMILKLTFNELIVMRILAVCLITAILFVTYKIFRTLKMNKYICSIFLIGIFLLLCEHFCIDYNFGILLIILITVYIELKNLAKGKEILKVNKKDFFLGILVGTSILFKQTTGLFFSAIYVLYKLLIAAKKEDFKKVFKIMGLRLFGVLIPVIAFCIYLTVNNIWYDFLDYTVYSLNTFSNRISYLGLIKGNYGIIIGLLSVILPIIILIMYFSSVCRKIKTEEQKNIFVMFAYSVASFIVVYPISDSIHFLIGGYIAIISLGYAVWLITTKIIKKIPDKKTIYGFKYFIKGIVLLTTLIIILISIVTLIIHINVCKKYTELKHFKFIPTSSGRIQNIGDFILKQNANGKNVYILDATAALYMIPLDKYNKDFDMFNKGNFGAKGEEGQIENLKNTANTVVLIMNEKYRRNWQNPEIVRDYIKKEWTEIGQIENFDIYEK